MKAKLTCKNSQVRLLRLLDIMVSLLNLLFLCTVYEQVNERLVEGFNSLFKITPVELTEVLESLIVSAKEIFIPTIVVS